MKISRIVIQVCHDRGMTTKVLYSTEEALNALKDLVNFEGTDLTEIDGVWQKEETCSQ